MSSNSPQQADQPTPERIDLIAKLRAEAESLPDAYVDAFKAEQVSDLLREAASALAALGPPPQAGPDSPSRDHDHAVSALGWRPTTERPQTGRKFVALYNDGSGARLFYQYEHGLIECEGDEFEELGDENYGFWAYVPDNYRFWCEDSDEDPIRFPPPPAENDLSGRTAKPTDPLTVQAEPSSPPQANTAGLVEAHARLTGEILTAKSLGADHVVILLRDAQALANHRAASQGSAE